MVSRTESARSQGAVLPRDAYFSREWFDREQEHLFGRCWQFAGMEEDVADPGSYLCVQVGHHPLFVVRDKDGTLRAFHNVCRHRGTALLTGTGRVAAQISCPYHRWNYSLDGRLRHISQQQEVAPDVDRSSLGLLPAGIAAWKGLVFVHPDPAATPLPEWLADLPERMGPYEPGSLAEVTRKSYDVRANWKIVMENILDNYHLGYVHPRTLAGLDHRRQEQFACGRHWFFYEPPKTAGQLIPNEVVSGLRPIEGLDATWYGSSYGMVFPNLTLIGGGVWWGSLHVVPVAPESTRMTIRLRAMPGQQLRLSTAYAKQVAGRAAAKVRGTVANLAGTLRPGTQRRAPEPEPEYDLIEEDVFCCEALQRGVRSPSFAVGPLAYRYEKGILAFQRNVLDHMP